ncbi:DUF397 domain-containing protein [Streptomyces acidiscabies]|uniref:DUF397 domain-containing protein n=1 Tax=Streptomyces acidiscabies TaxID=42234 RepID=A0AAP6BF57_9ACTN|nr:DUF397 domain-containing protein [Streptomyces acidiscabies]MBP5936875.1 DUF397 domain-containing protein [Streptomyces sp. LBUM 1476]MBZ3915109.1 DUF397 domain-containing protein [Streptomyces acidiscabies]MDX2963612.1 DUF397 domain-containing protein [Streptomyces acidiscabies]MDX3021171.1 DUF397 domain-containing protein [Streptomyces acidiscabies]MDX3794772.1 DUF397 domain-containing protein [Streptomyces acidiscabies]
MKPATTPLTWVKSSYSGHNDNCVEIATLPDGNRALRDSKNPTGPKLTFPRTTWADFLRSV